MANVIGLDPRHQKACSCRVSASIVMYAQAEVQTCLISNYMLERVKQDYVICPKCGNHIPLFTKQ